MVGGVAADWAPNVKPGVDVDVAFILVVDDDFVTDFGKSSSSSLEIR